MKSAKIPVYSYIAVYVNIALPV